MGNKAVFLDRGGTIARDVHYCRKPGTVLFHKVAEDIDIDFEASCVIGDIQMDSEAGKILGCKTVLVTTGPESGNDVVSQPDYVA